MQYEKRIGGLNRTATVLNELGDAIKIEKINDQSEQSSLKFFRVPLKTSGVKRGYPTDEKWKIIVNAEIEIDE